MNQSEDKIRVTLTMELSQASFRGLCLARMKTQKPVSKLVAEAVEEVFPGLRHRRRDDIVRMAAEVMPPEDFAAERAVAKLDGISLEKSLRRLVERNTPMIRLMKREEIEF